MPIGKTFDCITNGEEIEAATFASTIKEEVK
uniref:RE50045p n=1 Tax=Drosophila melanogaster TaxID=7227 RepID=Q8SYN8_DROME|nr:RE50045p [Drosophila melanogaster]